jgi:hypothetical protein
MKHHPFFFLEKRDPISLVKKLSFMMANDNTFGTIN